MKKLMIIAAVCAMASVAQAYAVNWSASNVRIPVATDPTKSQTGIVTTSGSDKFPAEALLLSLYWVDSDGNENLIRSTKNGGEGALAALSVIEHNDDLYKAIVADNGGDAVEFVMRSSYATAAGTYDFYMSKTGVDITGIDTKNKGLIMSMNSGTWDYTAKAVPEPTSGILLLLGVAGLALRRRRA